MRADRLLTILLLLQNNGKLTSRELADKLEVSERTIFRDMEALSAAGIPVFAERGSGGGWRLSEGYRTHLTGMKSKEILSLLLTNPTGLLDDLGIRGDFETAFQKLLAAAPETVKRNTDFVLQRIHIDGAGWHQTGGESFGYLPIVQEAVWNERKLLIRYRREGNEPAERLVHPLGLVAKRNVWYMVAEVDGHLRTYRISRLLDARLLDETFERPDGFQLAQYWEQSMAEFKSSLPRYPATVILKEELLSRLSRERYVQIGATFPARDGWLEAELVFETLDSASEIVLSFGAQLKVKEPSELRDRVKAEARAIVELYDAADSGE